MGKSCYNLVGSALVLIGFLVYIFRTLGDAVQVVRYHSDCRAVGVSGATWGPCFAEDDWGSLSSRTTSPRHGSLLSGTAGRMHYDLTFHLRSGHEVTEPVPDGLNGAMMPDSRLYTLTLWRGQVTQLRYAGGPAQPVEMRDSPVTALHWDGLLALIFAALLAAAAVYWKYFDRSPDDP